MEIDVVMHCDGSLNVTSLFPKAAHIMDLLWRLSRQEKPNLNVFTVHLVPVFVPEDLCLCCVCLCVISPDVSSHMAKGRNASESRERGFYEISLGKNVWPFCHLPLPDQPFSRGPVKSRISTLGYLVIVFLGVMGLQ